MTTAKIEKAIRALPNNTRERFLRKLWRQHEDACDRKIRREILKEGDFYLWEGAKKSHVKRHRHLKTRKKVSRSRS